MDHWLFRSEIVQIMDTKIRNLILIFIATGLFLLKRQYSGPLEELIHSYAGNTSVSFALYFMFLNLCLRLPQSGRLISAVLSLVCVESFEICNGFGIMTNTYDSFDLLAKIIGVCCALGLDRILSRNGSRDS